MVTPPLSPSCASWTQPSGLAGRWGPEARGLSLGTVDLVQGQRPCYRKPSSQIWSTGPWWPCDTGDWGTGPALSMGPGTISTTGAPGAERRRHSRPAARLLPPGLPRYSQNHGWHHSPPLLQPSEQNPQAHRAHPPRVPVPALLLGHGVRGHGTSQSVTSFLRGGGVDNRMWQQRRRLAPGRW